MHPQLIQINIRLLHHQYSNGSETFSLLDIPMSYWQNWKARGFDWIWLMGMWQNTTSSVTEYAFDEGLKKDYTLAIPDWKDSDVTGSPYAIDRYVPWERLGGSEVLMELRKRINDLGMKLMLDFVPNHFNAHSSYIQTHAAIFLNGSSIDLRTDPTTFYAREGKILAHGKDPYFPAWTDTVQVDYSKDSTRQFMIDRLLEVADYCDGVRCDMAMLLLNDVFQRTWNKATPKDEFWLVAIQQVKSRFPAFCFMAETYWDLEWQLQQLGFDYTYDKRLLDRMIEGDDLPIYNHLKAEYTYQTKSVRFLENHDEDRAMTVFGPNGSQAAAILAYTTPGLRFFFDGQQMGYQKHLPVQLGRPATEFPVLECWPDGPDQADVQSKRAFFFYQRLWDLLKLPLLKTGTFHLHQYEPNLFRWSWILGNAECYIVINWSEKPQKIQVPMTGYEYFSARDLMQGQELILFGKQYAVIVTRDS